MISQHFLIACICSGKIKTEKRQRKIAEDKLMQKMSSVDTPLQTLSKQVEKTKELSTPYLVLSGTVLPIYILMVRIYIH